MTEKDEQIVKAIWGTSISKRSKFCGIGHAQIRLNREDAEKWWKIFLLNKIQKRVS